MSQIFSFILFLLTCFYCIRQLRHVRNYTSRARALVNGDRREEDSLVCTGDLIPSSYQLLFQTTLLCGLLCLSPLFPRRDWMGLSRLKSLPP